MSRFRRNVSRIVGVLLCALLSCVGPPSDLTGWKCDKDHDCGKARKFHCVEGKCRVRCSEDGDCVEKERCKEEVCLGPEECLKEMKRPCYSGPAGTAGKGLCKRGTQTCSNGYWKGECKGEVKPAPEACDRKDNNCDGQIDEGLTNRYCYTGPSGTAGKGLCKKGTQTCSNGKWGQCKGEVKPAAEVCDGKDNDCDGKTDEELSRSCYTGPAGTAGKGLCKRGTQTCHNGNWGSCQGEVTPKPESCDGKDNDCDGLLDNVTSGFCASAEVQIKAGSFTMGSPSTEPGSYKDERPQHKVTLTHSFAMRKYEVTQGEFKALMGYNPSSFKSCGANCPVETVSWHEAAAFCNALSQKRGLPPCFRCTPTPVKGQVYKGTCTVASAYTGNGGKDYYKCKGYRLPTEAEWEYAARAGSTTAFYNGKITQTACTPLDPNLDKIGWYCGNSAVAYPGCSDLSSIGGPKCAGTYPVGRKQPNAWGLYDMAGNVWEWVYDGAYRTYTSSSITDPVYTAGSSRVSRGGSWNFRAGYCRSAIRFDDVPAFRHNAPGFRLVQLTP